MCQGISSSMQPLLYELEQLQYAAPNWQANAICVDSLGKLTYHLRLSKLKKSAELVANTIMHTPLASLGNKSLLQHSQD